MRGYCIMIFLNRQASSQKRCRTVLLMMRRGRYHVTSWSKTFLAFCSLAVLKLQKKRSRFTRFHSGQEWRMTCYSATMKIAVTPRP